MKKPDRWNNHIILIINKYYYYIIFREIPRGPDHQHNAMFNTSKLIWLVSRSVAEHKAISTVDCPEKALFTNQLTSF